MRVGVLAALVIGSSCGAPETRGDPDPSRNPVSVVDAGGDTIDLPSPALRVISLVPSATATLRAMGASDLLVGRTDFDEEPWAAALPSVGGGLEPNLEALVSLRPDLVVRFAGAQDPRTHALLDELGIKHVAVRPDRIDDIYETIEILGRLIAREDSADSLVAMLRGGLEAVAAAAAGSPPLRVVYVIGGSPPWVAGPGTYIDEIITLVGGRNVFADLGSLYAGVSPEELRVRDVDVVLVSRREAFDARLAPGARVVEVGDRLEIPGPDVVSAARELAALIYGDPPP